MEELQAEQINQSEEFTLCFAHKSSELIILSPHFLL